MAHHSGYRGLKSQFSNYREPDSHVTGSSDVSYSQSYALSVQEFFLSSFFVGTSDFSMTFRDTLLSLMIF